jgi:chemotaxis protein methyltransferase CheR
VSAHALPHAQVIADQGGDDPEGFAELLDKIARERGFQCASYKDRCLRRRIGTRMRAKGVHTFGDYGRVLDADAGEYDRLLDALTINVTKLFRNWDAWSALAERVIPTLWSRPEPRLRVWSAGASSGEEAYSLAALFHRHTAERGEAHRAGRVAVVGTDIDAASLAAAQRGAYAEAAFADTPAPLRARYFTPGTPSTAVPELRALVRFERHDLLRDPAPSGPWHLITCRNVLIYFDRDSQERLLQQFADALVPGGVLFLGKVETLLGRARSRFVAIDQRERLFRRLPGSP